MRTALSRSLSAVAAFAAVSALAVFTPWGQRLDDGSLGSFAWIPASALIGELRTPGLVLAVAAFAVTVVVRLMIGPRLVVFCLIAAVVFGYVVCVLLRDIAIVRPGWGIGDYDTNTLPSAHTVVAAMAFASLVALAPGAWPGRVLVGLGACCAFLAAVGSVASHAHRGADVIAGLLLAATIVPWASCWSAPVRTPRWLMWAAATWVPLAGLSIALAHTAAWPVASSIALAWACAVLVALVGCWARRNTVQLG